MAYVVGVPKRDSCQKCELPVFLAERMVVGKKVFHRTCLKCARCHAQLTPGSFYETEVDDTYCCETCPDEEEQNDVLLRSNVFDNDPEIRRSMRGSIAQRLAFFEKSEQSNKETGQKNVSDEEKSKSLQRLGETAAVSQSAFKMSSAFNNFLNDNIEEKNTNVTEQMEVETEEEKKSEDDDEETESEGNSVTSTPSVILRSETPQLPATPPPTAERLTAIASLEINLEQDNLKENYEKPLPEIKLNNISYNIINSESSTLHAMENDKINNNKLDESNESSVETMLIETEKEINANEEENNKDNIDIGKNYVAKDNTDNRKVVQFILPSALENAAQTDDINIVEQLRGVLQELESESSTDGDEPINKQENRAENQEHNQTELHIKSEEDTATTERLSVVRSRLEQFDVSKNVEENEKLEVTELKISETLKGAQVHNATPQNLIENENNNLNIENYEKIVDKCELDVQKTVLEKLVLENYPEDLNPFKSDDENEEVVTSEENKENVETKLQKDDKSNPFDSSDDEIELEKLSKNSRTSINKVPPPRPPPPRISRNPFGDDDEEINDDLNFSRHSSLSSSLTKKVPVPTPRNNM